MLLTVQAILCGVSILAAGLNLYLFVPSLRIGGGGAGEHVSNGKAASKAIPQTNKKQLGNFVQANNAAPAANISVNALTPSLKSAYIPNPGRQDALEVKSGLLSRNVNSLVLLFDLPPSEESIKAASRLCGALPVPCGAITYEDTKSEAASFPEYLPYIVVPHEDFKALVSRFPDLAPPRTLVFEGGRLLWHSSEITPASLYEAEMVLLTLVHSAGSVPQVRASPLPQIDAKPDLGDEKNSLTRPAVTIGVLDQTVYNLENVPVKLPASWVAAKRQPLLLIFWATWCLPCVRELPDLQQLSEAYSGKVLFVGIANDPPHKVGLIKKFLAESGVTYPQYRMDGHSMPQKVLGMEDYPPYPSFALFDEKGDLILSFYGSVHAQENKSRLLDALGRL
jgi:thiol-disulfide isomerase/thioredoxin